MRKFGLYDGEGMGGELIIFESDAPVFRLKKLEKLSKECFRKNKEIPIWSIVLQSNGYTCEYIDSCSHVTPYTTSGEWQKENFPEVKEFYFID